MEPAEPRARSYTLQRAAAVVFAFVTVLPMLLYVDTLYILGALRRPLVLVNLALAVGAILIGFYLFRAMTSRMAEILRAAQERQEAAPHGVGDRGPAPSGPPRRHLGPERPRAHRGHARPDHGERPPRPGWGQPQGRGELSPHFCHRGHTRLARSPHPSFMMGRRHDGPPSKPPRVVAGASDPDPPALGGGRPGEPARDRRLVARLPRGAPGAQRGSPPLSADRKS